LLDEKRFKTEEFDAFFVSGAVGIEKSETLPSLNENKFPTMLRHVRYSILFKKTKLSVKNHDIVPYDVSLHYSVAVTTLPRSCWRITTDGFTSLFPGTHGAFFSLKQLGKLILGHSRRPVERGRASLRATA